jgi:signal transduction histidine kinase
MLSYAVQEPPSQTDHFLQLQVRLIAEQVDGSVLLLTQKGAENEEVSQGGNWDDLTQLSGSSCWQLLAAEPAETRGILKQVNQYLNEQDFTLEAARLRSSVDSETDNSPLLIQKIGCAQGEHVFVSCFYSNRWHCLLIVVPMELTLAQQKLIFTCIGAVQEYLRLESAHQKSTAQIEVFSETLHRIGHSLRHPLGLIDLLTECWRRDLSNRDLNNPAVQESALTIQKVVRHLDQELSELINLGRCPQERQPHLLPALWQGILQRSGPYLEAKRLKIDCSEAPVSVLGDRQQLQILFENLLSNAISFSPVGGTISLRWEAFCQEVVLSISDQGPGFSAEDLQNLFKPFYTRRVNGIGLGMVIARKIVLDHYGSIWAQNRRGKADLDKPGLDKSGLDKSDPDGDDSAQPPRADDCQVGACPTVNGPTTGAEVIVILPR